MVNPRQKATTEQVRLAQVTQDAHSVSDSALTIQIKKVMELTRCSQADAEVALFDHDNNVDAAVLAVFDRPENGSLWKETKGRKSKKPEINEKEDYYGNRRGDSSKTNRGRNSTYQPRGAANPRGPRDFQVQGQEQRKDRPQQGNRGNTTSRSNHRSNNNSSDLKEKEKSQEDHQKFPAVDSFTSDHGNKNDENTWKNGPLVFEQSVPISVASAAPIPVANATSTAPSKAEKLSFAAVAASKKVILPPPAPSAAPSISTTSHVSSSKSVESQLKPEPLREAVSPNIRNEYSSSVNTEKAEPLPVSMVSTSVASTSFGPVVASNTVNKEFTDKLKNDIGIGLHSTPATPINSLETAAILQAISPVSSSVLDASRNSIPATHSSSLLHDVEFISGGGPSMLDFQFGFHPDAPAVDGMLSDRQQQQQKQLDQSRDVANNALSYMDTCSLEYNELRNNNNGAGQKTSAQQPPLNHTASLPQQQTSAQQQQQQQQHNSLQQQQQQMYAAAAAAQFPGYGFPYLYSPVASNMRDVEQLNSFTTMTPFAYGLNSMNQLDMQINAMLPPSATPQASALGSQNHHQSQTASSQHRVPPVDNKFQQGNVSSTNGMQSNNSYSQLSSQSGHQLRNQQGGMDNGAAAGPNAVAPPPGFSGPPFLTQPSFQSLFQLPSYTHPQLSMPYFLQGNTQQRQPQSQHAPQPASIQQQQHHQRPAEHASYLDMNKYPQQASITTTANSNNMLPQSGNSYQSLNSGPLQSGLQQRNQGVAGAGGLDNGLQYYQSPKWSGGNSGWRG